MISVCGRQIRIEGRVLRMARLDADKYHFLDDPETMIEGLRKCGRRIDLFTFMQRLPEIQQKYRYPMEWDNLAALPVTTFDHWWTQQIRSFPRNRARQAEKKGVVLREAPFDETLVRGIWEIYNECPVRQGKPFRHFGKDIETVYREEATYLDSSIFIGAYLGEKLIGFIKLTWDETRTQANLMNIVAMMQHRDKAPTNALIAHSVRACAERQIPYLVYQNFTYGNKKTDSMTHFKETNGFQRFDLPRYYVPLTSLGWAAYKLGLHHRFIDHLPEPVLAKARAMRNYWYGRRFQSATETS
jgi:hypothetical protein